MVLACVHKLTKLSNLAVQGTPAARMKKVPSTVVKKRSRELTNVFESFSPYKGMEGRVERIWITEIATDGIHLVKKLSCSFFLMYVNLCFGSFIFEFIQCKVSQTKNQHPERPLINRNGYSEGLKIKTL